MNRPYFVVLCGKLLIICFAVKCRKNPQTLAHVKKRATAHSHVENTYAIVADWLAQWRTEHTQDKSAGKVLIASLLCAVCDNGYNAGSICALPNITQTLQAEAQVCVISQEQKTAAPVHFCRLMARINANCQELNEIAKVNCFHFMVFWECAGRGLRRGGFIALPAESRGSRRRSDGIAYVSSSCWHCSIIVPFSNDPVNPALMDNEQTVGEITEGASRSIS